jgi:signal peptidase II
MFTFLAVLLVDQLTKYLVVTNFFVGKSIPIIEDVFHLTYVRNQGAAFGIMQGQQLFFIVVTIAIIVAVIIFYKELPLHNIMNRIALGLILGGAIGNLIDRIRLGYVIDFIDLRVWPVFNVADSAVVIAVVILSYWLLIIDNN